MKWLKVQLQMKEKDEKATYLYSINGWQTEQKNVCGVKTL